MTWNLLSRREILKSAACGFGYLALADLARASQAASNPLAPKATHHPAKAKRIIFLFMRGGPSHMDTFDYKPRLQRDDGKPLPFELPKLQRMAGRGLGKLMGSPFKFRQHGQSGQWISEVFPELSRHADRLCVLNGMHTEGVDHGQATIMLHTGSGNLVRPSMGSWAVYGLGSENRNLPGFVSICPARSDTGARGYSNAFLPAAYQGTAVGFEDIPATKATIRHIVNERMPAELQRKQLDLLARMNHDHLEQRSGDGQLEGAIQSFELGFRMQSEAPRLMDLSTETASTLQRYGIGAEPTDDFGRQCLMARRMAEAGVRYIQLTHTSRKFQGIADWDQHSDLKRQLAFNARSVDRPIAGLLTDLQSRGLLEDTLVWWGGEFGRTPVVQNNAAGRDHNPYGFSMWLAGGGTRAGCRHGETDEVGYYAVNDKVHMHDLHATILHLMGMDHEKLTYRYAGRDFRLTDVYGRVVKEIIA
jgi:hypothetical protein